MGRGRRLRAWAVVAPVVALAALTGVAGDRADVPALDFEQVVAAEGADRPPNPHAKGVGDLDGDGYPDIAAASSTTGPMLWYRENDDRSGWTVHTVRASGSWGTEMRAADIDGDGDLDLVTPAKDALRWYENPRPAQRPQDVSSWTEHTIGADGASAHDLATGDLDGDGRLDVVSRPKAFRLSVPATHVWLQTPTGWQQATILTELRYKGEGVEVGDVDHDGDLDIVGNGFWAENRAAGTDWSAVHVVDPMYFHPVHENYDASLQADVGVTVGDLTGDGRLDIVIGSSERYNGYLALYQATEPRTGTSGRWQRTPIDVGVSFVHGMRAADLDLDGDLDLVTAESHQTLTLHGQPARVLAYLNPGSGAGDWERVVLSLTGSHNIQTADFDADGDIDVAGANWGSDGAGGPAAPDGAKVYLWRNLLVDAPRSSTTTSSTTSGGSSTTSSSSSSTSSSTTTSSTTTTTEPASNLAPNPGFEVSPTTHYMTHGAGTFTWATDQAYTGGRSVKIETKQAFSSLARWMTRTKTIEAVPGELYRAAAYFRTTSVTNRVVLSLQFWDADLNWLGGIESLKLSGTSPWRLLAVERTAPAGAQYVRVEFRLYGPGTMWADDVSLVRA